LFSNYAVLKNGLI